MKIPRDLSGEDLAGLLRKCGYVMVRQKGSHLRLTTETPNEHHLTIPNHAPLKIGTLSAILSDVAGHKELSKEEVMRLLFE